MRAPWSHDAVRYGAPQRDLLALPTYWSRPAKPITSHDLPKVRWRCGSGCDRVQSLSAFDIAHLYPGKPIEASFAPICTVLNTLRLIADVPTSHWGHTPPSCGTARRALLHPVAKALPPCHARSVQQHIHWVTYRATLSARLLYRALRAAPQLAARTIPTTGCN